MNMLNSNAAKIEHAASSQVSSTKMPEETKTADLVIAKSEAKKASMPEPISLPEAEKVVEILNDHMNMLQTTLGFSIDKRAEQIIVTVKNRESDEIVRQIPAEELLVIQEKMQELTGLILNKKV